MHMEPPGFTGLQLDRKTVILAEFEGRRLHRADPVDVRGKTHKIRPSGADVQENAIFDRRNLLWPLVRGAEPPFHHHDIANLYVCRCDLEIVPIDRPHAGIGLLRAFAVSETVDRNARKQQ